MVYEAWEQKALVQEAMVKEAWAEDIRKGKNWQELTRKVLPFTLLREIQCQTLLSQPNIALFSVINYF